MATFDQRSHSPCEEIALSPLSNLQPTIRRITAVAIPDDIRKLKENQRKMIELRRKSRFKELKSEQTAASRTLKTLKRHLADMDRLKMKVFVDERIAYEIKVEAARNQAFQAIKEFIDNQPEPQSGQQEDNLPQVQMMAERQVSVEEALVTSESWDKLKKDLRDLNEMMCDYANLVHSQGDMVDSIEGNISAAQVRTTEAAKEIGKASVLKNSLLPVTGAVLGAVVGGPIGLFAGLKVGGLLTAVAGGYLGYKGAQTIKKHRVEKVEKKLQDLSDRNKAD